MTFWLPAFLVPLWLCVLHASVLNVLNNYQGLNIAHEAVDRHAAGSRSGELALRWLGKDGQVRDL